MTAPSRAGEPRPGCGAPARLHQEPEAAGPQTLRDRLNKLIPVGLGRRLAVATVASGVIWIAGTIATFALGAVLARSLGPAGYGIYGTAIAVVGLVAVPAQLGLPLLATREISAAGARGRPADAARLGGWFALAVVSASILLAGGMWIAAAALPLAPALKPALAAAAALLPALALAGLVAGLLRGQERVVGSQFLDVLARPLLFVTALLAWPGPIGVTGAIGAQTFAAAVIVLIGLVLFFRRTPLRRGEGARPLRAWGTAAVPMMLIEALRALDGSYAVLVASYAASLTDAGLLRVALASAMIASVPVSLQSIVVAPFLSAAHAAGETGRLARLVAGSTMFMTLSVGAVTLVVAAGGRWLLPLAFGPDFAGAYWPLVILCANQLLAAALGPSVLLLSMTGHERIVAQAFVLAVAAAIVAAILLTPRFGVMGTAASTIVATIVRGVLLNRAAQRRLGLSPSIAGALALLGRRARGARPA